MEKDEDKIRDIKAIDYSLYRNIDLNSLLVYIVDLLKDKKITINFENICVASYKLFPQKFSLINYKEYPDAARVNRGLLQCRPKYQNLLLGDIKLGFELTKEGTKRVEKAKILLNKPYLQKTIKSNDKNRMYNRKDEMFHLKKKQAYKKFIGNKKESIGVFDVYDLIDTTPYDSKKENLDQINTKIQEAKKEDERDLVTLLTFIKENFKKLFKDEN